MASPQRGAPGEGALLNTDDLKRALDIVVNLGTPPPSTGAGGVYRLFEVPFYCKRVLWDEWLAGSQSSSALRDIADSAGVREARGLLVKALDMDGDGKITPMDFQLMYDTRLTPALTRHQPTLDRWLPFAGQCVFGLGVGLAAGALARTAYRGRYWIAGTGFGAYTAVQYLAQQNFVNQAALEAAFRQKVRELADVNGDGEVNRDDVNALVDNRMRFIATKLGPGGLAPGAVGYASLALGFARGIRII
ncbi:EF hand [Novymonas esmeraldas]|uniref:EF hand n=1 Tax=Novymonas esmeraldas TaxID=1808958 RepID=A0AAW0F5F3_9TRYP